MENSILVSCTVCAYNSSKTILDTLESIKAQTYRNIELIVSDDCSTDNTVNICREWIQKNGKRFVRVELITVEKNTGITANCNRIWKKCHGEWIKGCAADDMLLPNCVDDYLEYIKNHPEARWVASQIRRYKDSFDEENCMSRHHVSTRGLYDLSAEKQLLQVAVANTIPAVSLFLQTTLIEEMGGYNTKYSFEDWPFNVNVLDHGYKLYFLDKETACYRFHDSTSQSKAELFNTRFIKESRRFQEEDCFRHLMCRQVKGIKKRWKLQDFFIKYNLNRRTPFISKMYYAVFLIINKLYNL